MPSEQPMVNLLTPEAREDPYPLYEVLRETAPVFYAPLGFWVVSRHRDVLSVLRDPRFSADRTRMEGPLAQAGVNPAAAAARDELDMPPGSMLTMDPPDHTRLRSLVNKAFTPRVVERLRPAMVAFVDDVLDVATVRGEIELIGELAYALPMKVIADLLGVPAEDREHFREWSDDIVATLDPVVEPDVAQRAEAAFTELARYFHSLVARRRVQPGDDLLSALIAAGGQNEALTEGELLTTAILLLVAGHETTVNLIGNGVLALLRNPSERARLQADPTMLKSAVEEFLRYDSPVQLTGRVAREPLDFHGHQIARGALVATMLGAANRDPREFAEPQTLDIGRADNRHVAFGFGIHFCLGAPLARAEAQAAIGALVRRFPEFELAGEPERKPTITLRGLASLPLRLG